MVHKTLGLDNILADCGEKPFDSNHEIISTAFDVAGNGSDHDRALSLYKWMRLNITYTCSQTPNNTYRSASEVFRYRGGNCVSQSFLYLVMSRAVGLESCYIDVKRDDCNKKVAHACSGVYIDNKFILVDTTSSSGFNIKHRKYFRWSDRIATDHYNSFSRSSFPNSVDYQYSQMSIGERLLVALFSMSVVSTLTAAMLFTIKDVSEGNKPRISSYIEEKVEDVRKLYDSISENARELYDDDSGDEVEDKKVDKLNFRDRLEIEKKLKFPLLVHRLKDMYPNKDFSDFDYNQKNYLSALRMHIDYIKSMENQ